MARFRGGPPAGFGGGGDDSGGGGDDDDSGGGGGSPRGIPTGGFGGGGGGDDDGGSPGGSSPPPSDIGGPSGGGSDPAPDPDPDPAPSPGGSSPPPSDTGGPSGGGGDDSGGGSDAGPSPGGSSPPPSDVGGPGPDSDLSPGGSSPPSDDVGGPSGPAPAPEGPGGSSPPASDVGGADPGATTPDDRAQPPDSRPENTDPAPGPGPTTPGGLGERDPGGDSGIGDAVRDRVTGAERDSEVVNRFTTGGFLSERGESAGLLPDEAFGVDISETRARETARDLSDAGEALDAGAVTNAQAAVVAPFTGGQGVQPDRRDVDPATDSAGESPVENAFEGAAQVPFDAPGGALQAETAAEVGQAVGEGQVGEQGAGDVTETGIAVGRDSAVRTAAAAQDSPGEFAGAVGAGLLLGGAGAASSGTAASGLRAGLRAEVDPRIGPFGTTAETRAGRGLRDFLSDDRGQADLTGFGRRDSDTGGSGSGAGSGDSPTQFDDLLDDDTQPIAGTDPDLDDARSQQLDQASFEATRRAAETRNQADLEDVARDPGTQTVDNRAGGRGVTTRESRTASRDRAPLGSGGTTGRSVGSDATDPELSPLESQLAAQLDTPEADLRQQFDPDTDAGTVTDARARQRDAEARFDARGRGLGAGAGGLFGVGGQDTPATGSGVGGLFGGFGGVGIDPDSGTDIFGDIGSDVFTGVDTDPGIDSDVDTDVDTTPGLDLGGGDVDLFDPDTSDPTTTDTDIVDPGEDPGRDRGRDTGTDPERDRDPDVPFDGDQDSDDSTGLFDVLARDDTVDSGILSGSEAAAELFGRR